jgi:CelD/BcsL family acetyltransferase involved in cellulose biosynthesis
MDRSSPTVSLESFDSLASYCRQSRFSSIWDCLFILPVWLKVWWEEFGHGADLYLGAVRQGEDILGLAPLMLRGNEALFIGSPDVCDYSDFIIVPGNEIDFFTVLLDDLTERGITRLELKSLRPESTVLSHLIPLSGDRKYEVSCRVEDQSSELDLPSSWEEYLSQLTQKQRHEVRRKLRRFYESGEVNYRTLDDSRSASEATPLFLKLFRESRQDKENFLTARRESFFRSLIKATAEAGLLRLGILELDRSPVAVVMCYDYHNTVFLYNNGYDPRYSPLSVGLVSKVLCIKDSIERGRVKFDFLKGTEEYKHRLGGKEVSLSSCRISLT